MRILQRFTALVCMVSLMAMSIPLPIFGQRVGERLRVTLDGDTITGTVSATSQSGFDLKAWSEEPRSIMYSEIKLLERSLGTQTYMKRGFMIGFSACALGGILLRFAIDQDQPCFIPLGFASAKPQDIGCGSRNENAEEAILGCTYAGILGFGIGAIVRSEEWEAIPAPLMNGEARISIGFDMAFDQRGIPGPVLETRILF